MKKILSATLIAGLFSGAVFAQTTVSSANIVGYVQVEKKGTRSFNLVGVNFVSDTQKLSDHVGFDNFTGAYTSAADADQISIWDSSIQDFKTYAYYYIDGSYPSNEGWKLIADFQYSGIIQDPVIPAGSALWITSSAAASNTTVVISGNVPSSTNISVVVKEGMNVFSSPYPVDTAITNLSISAHATGSYTAATTADQISVWNPVSQRFETYAYYYIDGTYPANEGWKPLDHFDYATPPTDVVIGVGSGFWYFAKQDFTWTEEIPYPNLF
jgi:hypothetical protein